MIKMKKKSRILFVRLTFLTFSHYDAQQHYHIQLRNKPQINRKLLLKMWKEINRIEVKE